MTLFSFVSIAEEALIPGKNVNIIGPPPLYSNEIPDLGLRQQNEPSCAVNPVNPTQICCGFNDYRGIDIPEIGDAWEGLSNTPIATSVALLTDTLVVSVPILPPSRYTALLVSFVNTAQL